ncbi:MAG: PPE family protein [Actinomycetota bacterium]|nr:PPE family protein [Actinomycetota bacterium]
MDFGALPPEINSGRMYAGPGPATLLAAATSWESLAAELAEAASSYQRVIASLTDEPWLGPASMSMTAAVMPFIAWMTGTAEQCGQAAAQATAAAAAFETAYAMTVPPPLVAANRVRLLALIQTNIFGQNTPAIMATEAEYSEMWAQDATAMYGYATNSAAASRLSPVLAPPQTANPAGLTGHIGAVTHAAAHAGSNTTTQWLSSVPQTLQGLSTPGSSSSAGLSQAAMGTGASLGASGASAPFSSLSSLTGASGKGAAKSASTGAGAASGLASALAAAPAADGAAAGLASEVAGYGADGAGLIADGGGIGIDLYGLDLDYQGLGLDYQGLALDEAGAGSILGAEGRAGIASMGGAAGLGNLGPLAGLGEGASASVGQASSLSTLSVPPSWAATVSSVTPLHALNGGAMPGGWAAAPAPGTAVSKVPLGGMVGRESEGAVQRVGMRVSLIPHSPVAG